MVLFLVLIIVLIMVYFMVLIIVLIMVYFMVLNKKFLSWKIERKKWTKSWTETWSFAVAGGP
jgi:hypothetical protein